MAVNTRIILAVVAVSVVLVVISTTLGVLLSNKNKDNNYHLGNMNLEFNVEGHTVKFEGSSGSSVLQGRVGIGQEVPTEVECLHGDDLCLQFPTATLKVNTRSDEPRAVVCEDFQWDAVDCRMSQFEDCFDMSGAHWYGATQIKSQQWPLEKWDRPSAPYVTGKQWIYRYIDLVRNSTNLCFLFWNTNFNTLLVKLLILTYIYILGLT